MQTARHGDRRAAARTAQTSRRVSTEPALPPRGPARRPETSRRNGSNRTAMEAAPSVAVASARSNLSDQEVRIKRVSTDGAAGMPTPLANREPQHERARPIQVPKSELAEREGFEPSIRFCRILTFQASAFDHSATAPHALEVEPLSGPRRSGQAERR